jgi:CheY-like chemotaxis protein
MPEGGRLAIETAEVTLDDTQAVTAGIAAGRYVMLSVADTGHGMDGWTRERIFEPFFTTKDVGKGTGLGLSMVFGIVKQSEGGIVVESAPRCGTTFRIYLPAVDRLRTPSGSAARRGEAGACDREAIPLAPRTKTRRPATTAKTILLVEDDDMLRAVIRRRLQSWGYRLFEAPSAEAALDWLRSRPNEHVDLLLTDLVMPGLDGRALARRVLAQRADVKVLFMSGYTEHCAVKTAAFGPDDHFIPKPFTANHLSRALMRVLGGEWLERQHA